MLFVDARQIYRRVDRAHRTLSIPTTSSSSAISSGSGVRRETETGSWQRAAHGRRLSSVGPIRDVPALCELATRDEITAQDWSLNPGRYVGLAPGQAHDDEEFKCKIGGRCTGELNELSSEAAQLQSPGSTECARSYWRGDMAAAAFGRARASRARSISA